MLCTLIFALSGTGQECRPISGTWRLVPAKSFFAGVKDPSEQAENETLVIAQDGANIEEIWTMEGTRLRGRVAYSFLADGTEQVIDKGARAPSSVRAQWQNCTLVADKKMVFVGGLRFEVRHTYVLAQGGAQLTIFQEAHSKIADVERRLVFERQ